MMIELAGLCDDFTTMMDIANQSFEFYAPLSDHLTNTSVASMFYNIGRTFVSVSAKNPTLQKWLILNIILIARFI